MHLAYANLAATMSIRLLGGLAAFGPQEPAPRSRAIMVCIAGRGAYEIASWVSPISIYEGA